MADIFDFDAEKFKRGPTFMGYSSVAEAIDDAFHLYIAGAPAEEVRQALEDALEGLSGTA
ncbi:MAG: hypothetical protein V4527_00610 [Pseudomonadota bacterium]